MKLTKLTFIGLQIVDSYNLTYLKYSNLCSIKKSVLFK